MPIEDLNDAREIEQSVSETFAAASQDERALAIRQLFVGVLDFDDDQGNVSLEHAAGDVQLPSDAQRIATLDGVYVLYVDLAGDDDIGADRVRRADAVEAARIIEQALGEDLLLVFTNRSTTQLHLIRPDFSGARPTLRRMVVERDLPRRTAVQQVANIYRDKGSIRAALDAAFDVEPVTKAFFVEYKRLYDHALTLVTGFDGPEGEDTRLFVQTLFNRLMFVYFLSRKGWLSMHGDKDYLNALWRDYRSHNSDLPFYEDRLCGLFFVGLNNPQSHNLMRDNPVLHGKIGDVPFLNGGLFEETDLDRRSKLPDVNVPDEVIAGLIGGEDALFNRFNFTVMESTPFDIEVAVDPEMLGKVFEELVTGRHKSGSYYTPRPVVSFMCREALKGYLAGQDTGLSDAIIASFVDAQRTDDIPVPNARKVATALGQVTVVDPACGSGAYLLGMMQELIELQTALYNAGVDSKAIYELKLEIIERNVHGTDIDPFAINIAMLRLWLSLAIDFDGDVPEPLPNLDFKVVCGDSLLGPEPMPAGQLGLFRQRIQELADALAASKKAYFNATGGVKDTYKSAVEQSEQALQGALVEFGAPAPAGAIDWRVRFADVFVERGGFDIAVANPPYVRQEKIDGTVKTQLLALYPDATTARSDLYCYFYARAMQLLRDGGMHVFICSNSWLDVGYGVKLQEYLLTNGHVLAVYESIVERQFSTADINTIISVIGKTTPNEEHETRFVSLREPFEKALGHEGNRRELSVGWRGLAGADARNFSGEKWGAKYLRAPDIYHTILRKCADKLVRLGDIATVRRGVTTGANEFFYFNADHVRQWGVEEQFLQPVMTSPQESRSIAVDPATLPYKLFLCQEEKAQLTGTRALEYIHWGEAQEYHLRPSAAPRRRWYDLGQVPMSHALMNKMIDTTSHTFSLSKWSICQ